jgi:hypothetical protein
MSEIVIQGTVKQVLPLQSGTSQSGKEWKKATIVVSIQDGQYEKTIAMDNLNRAEDFAKFAVGDHGTFYIDVISREYNGKWYTNVTCYKWDYEHQQPAPAVAPASQEQKPTSGELPF